MIMRHQSCHGAEEGWMKNTIPVRQSTGPLVRGLRPTKNSLKVTYTCICEQLEFQHFLIGSAEADWAMRREESLPSISVRSLLYKGHGPTLSW